MSRKRQQLPETREYKNASAFDTSKASGRARLWHERIRRAKFMLRIDERARERAGLLGYIDGTYPQNDSGDQVYLNEALPAIEDVIFGAMPRIPPVDIEPRQPGQEELVAMAKALTDATFDSGLTRAMPTTLQINWDEITWGIGVMKMPWVDASRAANYKPTLNRETLFAQQRLAEDENAMPLEAMVAGNDDHAVHIAEHERGLGLLLPDSMYYKALAGHIVAHYAAMSKAELAYPVMQRVNPARFTYDPDAVEWDDRRWECEECDEYVSDLERIPGVKNLNPENCPTIDEFGNSSDQWRKDESFDFENTRVKVFKIHDRLNDSYVIIPARDKEDVKPLLESDWPYGGTELYQCLVCRPSPDGDQIHGLSTLGLIKPLLVELAKTNAVIRRHNKRCSAYKNLFPRGEVNATDISDIENPNKASALVNSAALSLAKEHKPPSLPPTILPYRDMLLAELRRMLGSDIISQGGDTPHKITATESGYREAQQQRRSNRRQAQVSELLSWAARNSILLFRDFTPPDRALAVRVMGPLGMELKRLNPSDLPEDIVCKIDLEAASEGKRVEEQVSAQNWYTIASKTAPPGSLDPVKALTWLGEKMGIRDASRFFVQPGMAPLAGDVPGTMQVPNTSQPPVQPPAQVNVQPQAQPQPQQQPTPQPALA